MVAAGELCCLLWQLWFQVADASHISSDQEVLRGLVEEEKDQESFTVVAITDINAGHVPYLRQRIKEWTRQLA